MAQALPTFADLLSNPLVLLVVSIIVAIAVAYQRSLSWPEYLAAHRLKTLFARLLSPTTERRFDRPLLNEKGLPEGDREFLRHVDANVEAVGRYLYGAADSPHLVATTKRRPARTEPDAFQYSHSQFVWFHDDGSQTEAYLFRAGDGTDVYAHHETSVTDPAGHVTDGQTNGDPTGVVANALVARYGPNPNAE